MKAYVIKNKEGEYYFDETENDFVYPINNKCIYNSVCEIERRFLPSQALEKGTIVPITIVEGDLEEKYKVLLGVIHLAMGYACENKTLYKRMQDFNVSTNRHNGDNYVYLEDAICFLTKLSKDARDEAKKWGEFFEKVYQEQKAKESKDE